MPFIIAAGTFVTGFGDGIQSINLNLTPQIQRLYQLGSSIPIYKNETRQKSLNITLYSPGTPRSVIASTTCSEPTGIDIGISANGCGTGGGITDNDTWFLTSYSYNKDVQGWGLETYSLVTRPEIIGSTTTQALMIRGIAEGQTTTDGGANTGVEFITGSTQILGSQAEVTAGSPGIGKASTTAYGEVQTVGGGTGKADGTDGNASVNIPFTPIYIPL